MIQSKYNKLNDIIFLGFDSIEINLVCNLFEVGREFNYHCFPVFKGLEINSFNTSLARESLITVMPPRLTIQNGHHGVLK